MTEAKNVLQARADELRLELKGLDVDIKSSRTSVEEAERKLRAGKEFLNTLVQERVNIKKTIAHLEEQAKVVG